MQSFAYKVKSELCRQPVSRQCCARAEAYGVLLFCNTFTAGSNPARASLKSLIQDVSGIFLFCEISVKAIDGACPRVKILDNSKN